MKKPVILLVLVGIAVAWWFWWSSPTRVLDRRTRSFVELMNFDGGRGASIMNIHALSGLLAEEITVDAPKVDLHQRQVRRTQAESTYSWLAERAKVCRFGVVSVDSIEVDGDLGVVRVTLEGLLEVKQLRMLEGRYDVVFSWQESDRGWRLIGIVWPNH